jgi:tetratricopeptide (TPR) repeat protein
MSEKTLLRDKKDAIRCKNFKSHIECCENLGASYRLKGRLDEAFNEFKECAEVCRDNKQELDLARAIRQMGEIRVEQKSFSEGLKLIHRYLKKAEEIQDAIEIQRALITLGRSYSIYAQEKLGDQEKQKYLEKAEDFCRKAFNAIPKENCTSHERLGDFDFVDMNKENLLQPLWYPFSFNSSYLTEKQYRYKYYLYCITMST